MAGRKVWDDEDRLMPGIITVAFVVVVLLLATTAHGTPGAGPQEQAYARPLFQATPTPTAPPPIEYPVPRGALTDLNPIYAPFVLPPAGWTPHIVTSYDRTGDNHDWLVTVTPLPPGTPTPTGPPPTLLPKTCSGSHCNWLEIPADKSGVVTRIWMGMPAKVFGDDIYDTRIFIYSPVASSTPVAIVDVADLLVEGDLTGDYPISANSEYASGGIIINTPFLFDGGLRIESRGAHMTFFQVNYFDTAGALGDTGWVDVAQLAQLWVPQNMGQPVDVLSHPPTPVFESLL
jgi:hypothetical protein